MMYGPLGDKSRLVLAHSTATIEAFEGAVRSGKTVTSLLGFLRFLRRSPRGNVAVAGRTNDTIYRNLVVPLQQMLGAKRVQFNRGTSTLTILGRVCFVISANNERSVARIQGLTLLALYVDEASEIPESFFNMATTRLTVEGAKMWLTCNPAGRNHWLKTKWLDRAALWIDRHGEIHTDIRHSDIGLHRYTFVLDDNHYLPEDVVRRLKASYSGVWYRRYILSEWTNAEGAVYDMWDPARHVIPFATLPPLERVYSIGIDYGTTNASAAIRFGVAEGTLYLVDEWRHDVRAGEATWTDAQLSKGVRDFASTVRDGDPRPEWFAVDPSAASFRAQLRADGVQRVMQADNAVLDGIRNVASLLSLDRLKVTDHCPGWIEEAPGYAWDTKATAKGEDKPVKDRDHSLDAGRYAINSTRAYWRHLGAADAAA